MIKSIITKIYGGVAFFLLLTLMLVNMFPQQCNAANSAIGPFDLTALQIYNRDFWVDDHGNTYSNKRYSRSGAYRTYPGITGPLSTYPYTIVKSVLVDSKRDVVWLVVQKVTGVEPIFGMKVASYYLEKRNYGSMELLASYSGCPGIPDGYEHQSALYLNTVNGDILIVTVGQVALFNGNSFIDIPYSGISAITMDNTGTIYAAFYNNTSPYTTYIKRYDLGSSSWITLSQKNYTKITKMDAVNGHIIAHECNVNGSGDVIGKGLSYDGVFQNSPSSYSDILFSNVYTRDGNKLSTYSFIGFDIIAGYVCDSLNDSFMQVTDFGLDYTVYTGKNTQIIKSPTGLYIQIIGSPRTLYINGAFSPDIATLQIATELQGIEEAKQAALSSKAAAETASQSASNAEVATNYIKNDILSITAGVIRDSSGTVLQVARSNLTATNNANTTLGTVNTNVNTIKSDVGTVKSDVSSVRTAVGTMNTTVSTINTNVSAANTALGTVNTNVNTVKTDVGSIKTNVSSVKSTVGTVNTTLGTVNTNVGTVKTDVGTVVGDIKNSTYGLGALANKIDNLKSSVAPQIKKVSGLNGATCTTSGSFTVVIDTSGANEYRAWADSGSPAWGTVNKITLAVPKGSHTIYCEARSSGGAVAAASLNIWSL